MTHVLVVIAVLSAIALPAGLILRQRPRRKPTQGITHVEGWVVEKREGWSVLAGPLPVRSTVGGPVPGAVRIRRPGEEHGRLYQCADMEGRAYRALQVGQYVRVSTGRVGEVSFILDVIDSAAPRL
ncbi:MAG TPA: hypothetical protein VD973_28560 [Symbiobacteriaceae bacterium]|nr:hypothetical protein [Symbiobacteriaceae bacterium]